MQTADWKPQTAEQKLQPGNCIPETANCKPEIVDQKIDRRLETIVMIYSILLEQRKCNFKN